MPRRSYPSIPPDATATPPVPSDTSPVAHARKASPQRAGRGRGSSSSANNRKKRDKRDLRDPSALLNFGETYAPFLNSWTDSRIEQVRGFKHWTFVAIDTICRVLCSQTANISWVKQIDRDPPPAEAKLYIPRGVRNKALLPLQAHEHLQPVPHQHPLQRLLADPNSADVSWDFWYETLLFLLLTGNSYWWIPRNKLGLPTAIHVIPAHWVQAVRGEERLIDYYEIRPVEGNFCHKIIDADDVVHFRFKSPISKIDGYSRLSGIARWHDVHESMNAAKWNAYRNGTFPTVAVQFDGKLFDPTDEQLRRIEAKFYARHVGENRSNKPLFLPPGVKVIPLTIKPNEMVFGETASEMRDNILAAFGMNTAVVNASVGSYGANQAAWAGFYSATINPLLRFLGQVITEKVAWVYDESLRVWWEDRCPDDPVLTEQRIMTDMMGASISPNEIRALRGREPWPFAWADMPIMPQNMVVGVTPFGGQHPTNPQDAGKADIPAPTSQDSDKKTTVDHKHLSNGHGLHPLQRMLGV